MAKKELGEKSTWINKQQQKTFLPVVFSGKGRFQLGKGRPGNNFLRLVPLCV